MSDTIFLEIGAVIVLATVCAFVARFLKQPLIPAYVAAGFIIGPMLNLIDNPEVIATLSEIGIAFLLFIVGLEMDIRKLWSVGPVSIIGGLTQVLATFSLTFIVASMFGLSTLVAVYFGFIVALSSTMVVIKLLSDKKEIDTLHGRIVIGILLVQDIVAILALTVFTQLVDFSVASFTINLAKGLALFALIILGGRLILPRLFHFAASSQELLFVASTASAFLFSMLFILAGFSPAVGAFVAGLLLASLPYNLEIMGKVKPLRDFFSVVFFVSLGVQLIPDTFLTHFWPILAFTAIALFAKPIIITTLTSFFGYKRRTAFFSGTSLGQVSEFSLILAAQGLLLGHISDDLFSLTVIVTLATIIFTSYTIPYSGQIFDRVGKKIGMLDKLTGEYDKLALKKKRKDHVILCGYNRIGYGVLDKLKKMRKQSFVVDYNPEVIKHLISKKVACAYGDVTDEEILEKAQIHKASILISTIPEQNTSLFLTKIAKKINKNMVVFMTAHQISDALELYDAGADYVVLPHLLGGDHVSLLLEEFKDNFENIIASKIHHVRDLQHKHKLRHNHLHSYLQS